MADSKDRKGRAHFPGLRPDMVLKAMTTMAPKVGWDLVLEIKEYSTALIP